MSLQNHESSSPLATQFCGLQLQSPLVASSGTFAWGVEYNELLDLSHLGAICLKGLTLLPKAGNPDPRVCELPYGMLNSVGLQNVGLDKFLKEIAPNLAKIKPKIIVNIAGHSVEEFSTIVKEISSCDNIHMIELNISCPNVKGGLEFSSDVIRLANLIHECRKHSKEKVLITKLSPNNIGCIKTYTQVCQDAGAHAISLINTLLGMSIDVTTKRSFISSNVGGYSGPGIKPIALRFVFEAAQELKIPILGIGGVWSGADAIEFLLVGATLVGVGTANLVDPTSTQKMAKEIQKYCYKYSTTVQKLVGEFQSDFDSSCNCC